MLPIWGIQEESELDEWLSYMDNTPNMTDEIRAFISKEQEELSGDFWLSEKWQQEMEKIKSVLTKKNYFVLV